MVTTAPYSWVKESTKSEPRVRNHTAQQRIIMLLRRANLFRPAALIEKCNEHQATLNCVCGNELRIVRQHCRQALCPECQRLKAYKVSKEVEGSLCVMRENLPGLRVLFLTLTIPACEAHDLKKELTSLPKNFTKLIRTPELKSYVIGSVRVLGIGFNHKTNTFNPHLHALLIMRASYYSKGYLSQARFLALWKKVTAHSDITQMHIKPVKPNPKKKTSLATEIASIVQYMLKPFVLDHWTPESIVTLSQAIHKRRQYDFLGDFKFARKFLPPYKPACLCANCISKHSSELP